MGSFSILLFLFVFSGRLISVVMNYLHIERHLAAKFGTDSVVLLYKSSLQMISYWSGVVCF
jgi:hypothetical protein